MTVYQKMRTALTDEGVLTFPLAVTAGDRAKFFNLASAPHALWAGTTGSGKSVSLNVALATMVDRNDGSVVFDMIDPKRVELSIYRGVRGVRQVATDMDEATGVIHELLAEMDERYQKFEQVGVRKLEDYNDRTGEALPYRVLVVDELSDLMDTHKAQVLPPLVRIGQLGRAAGIHMMLATQRPAADTIPKKLLANVPARIGLLCQSHTESRLILGEKGAEDLNGHGDMLVKVPGEKGLTRGQGPFLSDSDLAEILGRNRVTEAEEEAEVAEFEEEARMPHEPEADEVSPELVDAMKRVAAEEESRRNEVRDLYERLLIVEREKAEVEERAARIAADNERLEDDLASLTEERDALAQRLEVADRQRDEAASERDEAWRTLEDSRSTWKADARRAGERLTRSNRYLLLGILFSIVLPVAVFAISGALIPCIILAVTSVAVTVGATITAQPDLGEEWRE